MPWQSDLFTKEELERFNAEVIAMKAVIPPGESADTPITPVTGLLGHTANFEITAVVPSKTVDQETIDAMLDSGVPFKGFN